MTRIVHLATFAGALAGLLVAMPAAQARHRHHRMQQDPAAQPVEGARKPFSFYPEEIEGGVSGNLPFNNQIRKHVDPLNANGGR